MLFSSHILNIQHPSGSLNFTLSDVSQREVDSSLNNCLLPYLLDETQEFHSSHTLKGLISMPIVQNDNRAIIPASRVDKVISEFCEDKY